MQVDRIEAMSSQQCADALVVQVATERAASARRLLLVAQWAVLHDPESIPHRTDAKGRLLPGTEQARSFGGDGTPEVAEFAVHELAVLLGLPVGIARNELADVLDLVFRHPLLWARVLETAECDTAGRDPALAVGMVQAWQATWVARRCRHAGLCHEAAQWVDEQTTAHLGRQPWTAFQNLVEGKIKDADPELAERRRMEKEAAKRVTVSRTNDAGLKTLTVQAPAAQIIVMRARIHQLALILQAAGAAEALAQLEADAAYLLCTNPLQALLHLIDAAAESGSDPVAGPEPAADGEPVPDRDDPLTLFDDRPVRGRETSQPAAPPGAAPPSDSVPPDSVPPDPAPPDAEPPGQQQDPDLVPESVIHPAHRDEPCPTCGHDPTRAGPDSAALGAALRLLSRGNLSGLDPAKLRPTAVLYLHSSEAEFRCGTGTVRFENDGTAFTQGEAIDILGHAHVKITRVIDLNGHQPVDCYEIPGRLAEQVRLAYPTEVFPFSATSSRSHGVDQDHSQPYVPTGEGGPPGQTSLDNLAPLHRGSHRVKTHGRGWATLNPRFGTHLWRTPHGYCFQRDPSGTIPLGKMTHQQLRGYALELAEHIEWDEPDAPESHAATA